MFQAIEGRAHAGIQLIAATALLYGASRAAIFALARPDGSDAGRRAIAQWLPIAATVISAVLLKQPDVAVALIFGTSVACLSLVLGLATYLVPAQVLPASRKAWAFVFPATLLIFMAGLSAKLAWWHAIMLLALGGAVWVVWRQRSSENNPPAPNRHSAPMTFAVLTIAIVAMAFGSVSAVHGTLASSVYSHFLSPGTLAATLLSALLVMPTLGTSSAVAQTGNPGGAMAAIVGTVLLNLCCLLPIAILLWYVGETHPWSFSTFRDFQAPWESTNALPYSMVTWRIETVILIALGFGLVPVATNRWTLGRLESGLLVLGYAIYIMLMAVFSLDMI